VPVSPPPTPLVPLDDELVVAPPVPPVPPAPPVDPLDASDDDALATVALPDALEFEEFAAVDESPEPLETDDVAPVPLDESPHAMRNVRPSAANVTHRLARTTTSVAAHAFAIAHVLSRAHDQPGDPRPAMYTLGVVETP
jgi:hypothetical protein